jgi:hypothetical protein
MDRKDNAFSEKVESILDELFAEDDSQPDAVEESTSIGYYPLRFLKATVLSIDWEITDEIMSRFIDQVERLKESHKSDKTVLPLLQMLGSVGQHIRIFKENAHPNALKILKSLYISLEKVIITKEMSDNEKNRLLYREIRKFKALKGQIVSSNLAHVPHKKGRLEMPSPNIGEASGGVTPQTPPPSSFSGNPAFDRILSGIEQLKDLIRGEFEALREELKR